MQRSQRWRRGSPHSLRQISKARFFPFKALSAAQCVLIFVFPRKVNHMTDIPDPMRRKFLAGVPLASASLALGANAAQAADAPVHAPVDPRQPLFNTTDHVATYYRLARS